MFAYGVPPGPGGLGHHASHVLSSLAPLFPHLRLYGPLPVGRTSNLHPGVRLHAPPTLVSTWRRRYTWLRYMTGAYQQLVDESYGSWLGSELAERPFTQGYFLTQIARESLVVARRTGARTILDNPNGHIRDFREALRAEAERWTGWPYAGHPSEAMVERVEAEYDLADRIRVSSRWSKQSLVRRGIEESKIFIVPQAIDTDRFVPPTASARRDGPLRLVFVGSFSLGKGFQYLLQAIARLGAARFRLEMVGATGDPWSRRLLSRLSVGLDVVHAPGDPLAAYQRGELFVFPTLHDGFGLVAAEAMACGLPVVTTDCCGAAEWIQHGESGWVLPAGDDDALATALDHALGQRDRLGEFGKAARRAVEQLSATAGDDQLQKRIEESWSRPYTRGAAS